MESARPDLVVVGDVVVAALRDGLETAGAVGIADGRVVMVGDRHTVTAAAAPGARVVYASGSAVVPGLHDAHIHLVDLARSRVEIDLTPAGNPAELRDLIAHRLADLPHEAWVLGRGWSADSLPPGEVVALQTVVADRRAFLRSRDGHSAWASAAVLARAGLSAERGDPPGGRIERNLDGSLSGIVRETAVDLVRPVVERARGAELARALGETLDDLAQLGLTGFTDAGDFTADGGTGRHAGLGDSFSSLAGVAEVLAGRARVTINIPRAALGAARAAGLRTGQSLDGTGAVRVGWVKLFSDGALGSRTAALFEPYSCEAGGDGTGFMILAPEDLDAALRGAHSTGIGVAVHAIGDRANAVVLDAYERAPRPTHEVRHRDRIEHAQLTRPADRLRMSRGGVVASMQPIHCLSDRAHVERCWAGRQQDAYAWRSIGDAGVVLAFGSDAPVESPDPWLGVQAAVHRRLSGEPEAWQPQEALSFAAALNAYTMGPATALGVTDEGHLRVGARADLAVLNRSLADLMATDDYTGTRSDLTLLAGRETWPTR